MHQIIQCPLMGAVETYSVHAVTSNVKTHNVHVTAVHSPGRVGLAAGHDFGTPLDIRDEADASTGCAAGGSADGICTRASHIIGSEGYVHGPARLGQTGGVLD